MPNFNPYTDEVAAERRVIRDYGGISNAPRHADTYKAQALRELAARLELESRVRELESRLSAAIDLYEAIDDVPLNDYASATRARFAATLAN